MEHVDRFDVVPAALEIDMRISAGTGPARHHRPPWCVDWARVGNGDAFREAFMRFLSIAVLTAFIAGAQPTFVIRTDGGYEGKIP